MNRVGAVVVFVALAAGAMAQEPVEVPAAPAEAVVSTDAGAFVIRLRSDLAPAHVKYFVATARKHGYDKTTFHRIIPGGIIQGGDPLSRDPAKKALYGTGGLGVLKAEFSPEPMRRGSVAAVLRPSSKDSAGTQFFVCLGDQPSLTGKYTIFGEVAEGMDVVDAIGRTPVEGDKPTQRVEIRSVEPR